MSSTTGSGAFPTSPFRTPPISQYALYSRCVIPRDVRPPGSTGSSSLPPSLTRTQAKDFCQFASISRSLEGGGDPEFPCAVTGQHLRLLVGQRGWRRIVHAPG